TAEGDGSGPAQRRRGPLPRELRKGRRAGLQLRPRADDRLDRAHEADRRERQSDRHHTPRHARHRQDAGVPGGREVASLGALRRFDRSRKIAAVLSRGVLAAALVVGLVVAPVAAGAQPPEKMYLIGILADKAGDANEILAWQNFRDGLREHGWKEGVNIRIESRWIEGDVARLPEMAAELVRLKPDLIATRGSLFTAALQGATGAVPLFFL